MYSIFHTELPPDPCEPGDAVGVPRDEAVAQAQLPLGVVVAAAVLKFDTKIN